MRIERIEQFWNHHPMECYKTGLRISWVTQTQTQQTQGSKKPIPCAAAAASYGSCLFSHHPRPWCLDHGSWALLAISEAEWWRVFAGVVCGLWAWELGLWNHDASTLGRKFQTCCLEAPGHSDPCFLKKTGPLASSTLLQRMGDGLIAYRLKGVLLTGLHFDAQVLQKRHRSIQKLCSSWAQGELPKIGPNKIHIITIHITPACLFWVEPKDEEPCFIVAHLKGRLSKKPLYPSPSRHRFARSNVIN